MKPLTILLSSILFISSAVNANAQMNAIKAFDEMKSLVGVWKKEGGKSPNFSVSFELTANNYVLVETWLNKGRKHSFTMYHLDKNNLLATHYCPQGNQPRLKLTSNSTVNNLSFNFLDATNLINETDSHQHSLGFEFTKGSNTILRKESYVSQKGEDFSKLILVRGK